MGVGARGGVGVVFGTGETGGETHGVMSVGFSWSRDGGDEEGDSDV